MIAAKSIVLPLLYRCEEEQLQPCTVDLEAAAEDYFEPLLTVEEAAQHLRLHPKTLQRFAREGRVPCARLGKYWMFRLSILDVWVRAQQDENSQPFLVK